MAKLYPTLENIHRLKVKPTEGELALVSYLSENLGEDCEVFFNPYLDGDRPDVIILKEHCGCVIIEVKDWDLSHYEVNFLNKWTVTASAAIADIRSPHSQAFRYKKNLYDLHLPVLGLSRLKNRFFFKLVDCYVYFHRESKDSISAFYRRAESELKNRTDEYNAKCRAGNLAKDAAQREWDFLNRKRRNLNRDKNSSIGNDQLIKLVKKIKELPKHILFTEEIYRDFKRRLSPPEHTLNQGISVEFDKFQSRLVESKSGLSKIKGVAGCGKTTILAKRATNAHFRHSSNVLILTFNITLKNLIKDKISDFLGYRDEQNFEVTNYHQFFNSQLNNADISVESLIERFGLDALYSTNHFLNADVPKFQTILIDEIQDYDSEWVKIIRDSFLDEGGELILFGDESQDIYQRENSRAAVIARGFGEWIKLKKSYRTNPDSRLLELFKDFQINFLVEKHNDTDIIETSPTQMGMTFSLMKYHALNSNNWLQEVFEEITNYIRGYDLHPNDVVILGSKVSQLRQLNEIWIDSEHTHCMFETIEDLVELSPLELTQLSAMPEEFIEKLVAENKDEVESIRRTKKNHFYQNTGLVKLSTTHSFKGLESKTVFYVLLEDDSPELVYTAITRSTENLVIFDVGGRNACSDFFRRSI